MKTNIWEINDKYYCLIAGYCLTHKEQLYIVRRFVQKKYQKYAINKLHDTIIDCISEESDIPKYVQKLLDKKYSKQISYYKNIDNEQYLKKLGSHFNWKDFGALIWISAVYRIFNDDEQSVIMDKSHLYGHEIYHQLYIAQTKLEKTDNDTALINEKYFDIRNKFKAQKKELKFLRDNNYQLNIKNKILVQETIDLRLNIKKENPDSIRAELLQKQSVLKDQAMAKLKNDNKKLSKKINSQMAFFVNMGKDFDNILIELKNQNNACNTCEKIDLCQQKILIVGGITKMETYYRKIVQEIGGQFYYHDGNSKQGESALSHLVNLSDVVICPIDVNSHFACLQVKKICKKTNTDYHMLRKSSLSSIYNALKLVASN